MEVERLTAVLEASGLGTFQANMAAADRATGGTKDQLRALTEISKVATEALKHVKLTAAQAMESKVSAESILQGVKGIGEEARQAARDLDRVHLSEAQAMETKMVAEQQVRSLKEVEHQAIKTRAAQGGGGGGPGMAGFGRGMLLPAAIGLGVLTTPAAGPGALGLLAAIPVLATTGAGALGTLALAFQGVSKAIMGNKKAFDELGPSAQQFVLTIRSLDGWFDKLKQTAGGAMFPGLTAGLKAALSPGTVNAITQAVTAFGHAIGDAGAMFGRYFGSQQFQSIFGPLMQSGARNFSLMADAALHLFDAMGVLGRAAIPLVGWMVRGVDAASRWADAFTRSKDATGGLGRAMDQAKQSLQLVGNLFAALAKAVYELGAALYPVSKVAVKDLTDGLNYLAGIFQRNRQEIRDLVGGALAALVSLIKTAWPVVTDLAKALQSVATAVGGWKAPFEIILSYLLLSKLGTLAARITGIGTAAGESGAAGKVGLLASRLNMLKGLGIIGVTIAVTEILSHAHTTKTGLHRYSGLGGWANLAHDLTGGWIPESGAGGSGGKMPNPHSGVGFRGVNLGPNSTGVYSQKDVYKLLTANGLPPDVSANLSRIAMAESGGRIGALNNNPKTGDYSVGLFQENFLGQMGKNRVAKYAPQFGMSSDTSVTTFTSWLKKHPSAQAKIAYDIYQSQGYGAWSTAKGLGITGGGSNADIWGPNPPWTTGLGPKPPKPSVIPAAVTRLLNRAKTNATNASTLSNTGGTAARYLHDELVELEAAQKQLEEKFAHTKRGSKASTQLDSALTSVEDKIIKVRKLITDAIIVTGDALLPDKLNAKLKRLTAQFTADSGYATVLVGDTADKYRKTLQKDLLGEAAVYQVMLQKLKSELAGKSAKQQAAIQDKIKSVQTSLEGVQQQILSNLQANVTSLQSKVGTLFGNVTQQFDAALGKLFFQNGMKTALEQQLADMQAEDQLSSLRDSIQQAKDQLAQDQTGGLAGVQFDAATGLTKNLYSAGAAKQLAADQKALDAAQRQLDEYNLGIKAAAERADLDKQYSEQVTTLNKKLAKLAEAFQNGTGSMQALRDLADQYGIVITDQSIPDFQDLSSASNDLKLAFIDLGTYIGNITGATPKIPAGGGGGGGGSAPATSPGGILQNLHAQAVNGVIDAATYQYLISGHKMEIPGMARGGIVKAKPGGTIVRLAEAGQDEEVGPVGGRGGGDTIINLTVNGSVLTEGDLVDAVYAGLLRKKARNGKNLQL